MHEWFVPNGSWPPPPTPQNGPYLWKSCACMSYYLAIIPPCIYATISIIKYLQHDFPKMRGGSKAVWVFSKNSSDLVAGSFLYSRIGWTPSNCDTVWYFLSFVWWRWIQPADYNGALVQNCRSVGRSWARQLVSSLDPLSNAGSRFLGLNSLKHWRKGPLKLE